MPLIDDDGNLFGRVNVIDAVAVVVVVAVLVAGITFLGLIGGGEPDTRYATIELGPQPDYVVDRLEEGDVATFEGFEDNVTVRDVYVTPSSGEGNTSRSYVTVRAEVNGELIENDRGQEVFHFTGERFRLGNEIDLDMGEFVTAGEVTDIRYNESTFSTGEATALVEIENADPSVAERIEEGMTETTGGETLATVTEVESEPATVVLESEDGDIHEREHPQNRDVSLVVELQTQETESGVRFRGQRLGVGSSIVLTLDSMSVHGEVAQIE